jgi:hypothetical protein
MQHADALAQLAREVARARQRETAARIVRLALPIAIAMGVWAALWLSGWPLLIPPLAQTLLVLAALSAFLGFSARAARRYRPVTPAEARAQLALDSKLDADAFEALGDLPAKLDPSAIALWRREQARAAERAGLAKAGPARLQLQRADPWRLRYGALVLLAAGGMAAGVDAPDRLTRAFLPDPGPLVGDRPMAIEAWIEPAPYTRAPPISLSDQPGARIITPPSVDVVVRVTGPAGPPALVFEGESHQRIVGRRRPRLFGASIRHEVRFKRAADGAYEARLAVPGEGRLRIVRFLTRAHWRIAPSPDALPTAEFVEAPKIEENDEVSFAWSARDDYGVRSMVLRATPAQPPEGLARAAPVDTPIEAPSGDPREAQGRAQLDLARHPYAGMDVDVAVVAFDARGQAGSSQAVRMMLPERVFLQPLAQAAIEVRRMILWERCPYAPARPAPGGSAYFVDYDPLYGVRRLALRTDDQDPRLERAPDAIQRAVRFLHAITLRPQDGYIRDGAVFLGFSLARSELENASGIAETDLAAETLWRTALRAEYGAAADARRALEMAQQALNDAMADGASPERLRQLMQALRQAMENYLQSLVLEAMRNGESQQSQEDAEEQTSLSQRDIEQMMQEVERLMREGRTEEAQALLSQLTAMLQNLEVRLAEGGQQGEGGGQQERQPLSKSMETLSGAIGDQRALNDETQREAQGEGGDEQGGGAGRLAERQNRIREGLGEARRQAGREGAQSGALDSAEQAMRRAENALRSGDYESARAAQDEALNSMRRGANELGAEMSRRAEGDSPTGPGRGERDPLGRTSPTGGSGDGDIAIPDQTDRARAREILDDIRRRAQDPNRPEAERDYLRRLLDRFADS